MTGTIYHADDGGQPDCNSTTTVSSNLPGSSAANAVAASSGSDLFEWDASSGTCVDQNHNFGPEYFNSGGDVWFSDDQTNWYFYQPGGAGWNSTSVTCPGGGGSAPTISSHPSGGSDVCVGGSPSTMSITDQVQLHTNGIQIYLIVIPMAVLHYNKWRNISFLYTPYNLFWDYILLLCGHEWQW